MTTFRRTLVCVASLASLSPIASQAQTAPGKTLPSVTVTGNPLGATDMMTPSAQLGGAELLLRAKTTLGETLDGTPGISSTYFGPNASRPVIRGLDGDRIRILSNGGSNLDASGLSADHAVTSDPLSIERIEVLRGPGALQYGGSAIGGVVNVIDSRIPRTAFFGAQGDVAGKLDIGLATANAERGGGAVVETGTERYALHLDASTRHTQDVAVPVSLACSKPGTAAFSQHICNSASHTQSASAGGSIFFASGYLGASINGYQSDYGTVAEDEVTIGMKSNRLALAGEVRDAAGLFKRIKFQAGRNVYQHTEFEGSEVGTVFKSSGNDLRIEGHHAPWGNLDGLVGVQLDHSSFSADGDEAFAPHSNTRQSALFAYEELKTGWGKLSFGLRAESVSVQSFGNPTVDRFTPGSRSFNPVSVALGGLWTIAPGWQITGNLAATQRAPKDYELFANGPHLATSAYEVGNSALAVERSTNLDVGASWKGGHHRFSVNLFANRFGNYLAQNATGVWRDTQGNGAGGSGVTDCGDGTSQESGCTSALLPEYVYTQVTARLRGIEVAGNWRLLDAAQTLDLDLRADVVHGINQQSGQPLARMAPARLGAALVWNQGNWSARVGASHSEAHTAVPDGQVTTPGHTLWNASVSWRQEVAASNLLWYARLDNATDALAYSATSILTQTAPGKAPLPGRNLKVGVQVSF